MISVLWQKKKGQYASRVITVIHMKTGDLQQNTHKIEGPIFLLHIRVHSDFGQMQSASAADNDQIWQNQRFAHRLYNTHTWHIT